jgi:hypothetical protein
MFLSMKKEKLQRTKKKKKDIRWGVMRHLYQESDTRFYDTERFQAVLARPSDKGWKGMDVWK